MLKGFQLTCFIKALEKNFDIPETVFTNFHISDHLKSFDSDTNYIGLMISSVKYQDKWYHDGKQHTFLSHTIRRQRRQKRYARKTHDSWYQWTRQKYATTEPVPVQVITGSGKVAFNFFDFFL